MMKKLFGTALHTPEPGRLEALENRLIVVDDQGVIEDIRPGDPADADIRLEPGQFLLPGLVDLHIHAPQWPQLGKALDVPLEIWLQRYTFPLESRYADVTYAESVWRSMIEGLLANGTTTALYFATIHLPASQRLAELCLDYGQRALVGRVAMDHPEQCPDGYRDASPELAEAETRAFIDHVRGLAGNQSGLVLPVITPRFIPSCTDELLHRLGRLAAETGCHVQTHCSESDWEHDHVKQRCGVSDSVALGRFGLLSRRTVLAHGNFIDEGDRALIKRAGAAIAHCPLSNVYFSDAVFPLRQALDEGLHVGLGSDVAGGASPSILASARHAVIASRTLESGVDPLLPRGERGRPGSRIDALEAFWLATAGGGISLDLPIGLFKPGYQLDALLVDVNSGDMTLYPEDSPADILHKIVYLGGRANIRRVWVAGRQVYAINT
jgi:guanine deaminase